MAGVGKQEDLRTSVVRVALPFVRGRGSRGSWLSFGAVNSEAICGADHFEGLSWDHKGDRNGAEGVYPVIGDLWRKTEAGDMVITSSELFSQNILRRIRSISTVTRRFCIPCRIPPGQILSRCPSRKRLKLRNFSDFEGGLRFISGWL